MAFIKYSSSSAVEKVLSGKTKILCRDIPLQIRKAFDEIKDNKNENNPTKYPHVSSNEFQKTEEATKNHRVKFAAPNPSKLDGFSIKCKCHHCVKTREKNLRGRLAEVMKLMEKLKAHHEDSDFEELSIKLMERQLDYMKILNYYRHNY